MMLLKEAMTTNSTQLFNNTTIANYQKNQTARAFSCSFPLIPEYDYTSLVLAFFILLLNGFALFLFCTRKVLRKLTGNYILASLSVNDFLNGCFILYNLFPRFYLHETNCRQNQRIFYEIQIPTIGRTIYRILMLSSVTHLVLLSTDRLIYVIHALTYNSIVTKRRVLKILATSWITCIVCSGVQLFWSLIDSPLNSHRTELKFYHTIILAVLFIGLPSVILMLQSIAMVMTIRRLDIHRHSQCLAGKKAFVLYVCMYLKFVLFSYPYFILSLLFEINPKYLTGNIPMAVVRIFLITRFLPCLVNPCLYSLQNNDYRTAVKTIFRQIAASKNELFHFGGSPSRGKNYSVNNNGIEETSLML